MFYEAQEGNLTVAATGDNLITRRLSAYREPSFLKVFEIIRSCDVRFANFEMLFHDFKGYPSGESGGTWMQAPPGLLDDLAWAGFNLAGLANNHTMDYGIGGLRETIRQVEARGFAHAGAGEHLDQARSPAYLDLPGGRVALLAASTSFVPSALAGRQRPDIQGRPGVSGLRHQVIYQVPGEAFDLIAGLHRDLGLKSPRQRRLETGFGPDQEEEGLDFAGLHFVPGDDARVITRPHSGDLEDICRWIRDARRQADWVVFSLHAHEEGQDRHHPPEFISQACRRFIDEGADVILGHGPHVLRGIEIYRQRPIFYSLGNFIYQNETVQKLPSGYYEMFGLGLGHTPADAFDARTAGGQLGRPADPAYWESILPVVRFKGWELESVELYPLQLGFGAPRSQRGRPLLAESQEAEGTLDRVAEYSRPFGTEIAWSRGRGQVSL